MAKPKLETNGPGHEKLHGWFNLTYASYLTIPRTVLQSMPDKIQGRLADVLAEMDAFVDTRNFSWPPEGAVSVVQLRKDGRFIKDELCDYERGRRRLWGK